MDEVVLFFQLCEIRMTTSNRVAIPINNLNN